MATDGPAGAAERRLRRPRAWVAALREGLFTQLRRRCRPAPTASCIPHAPRALMNRIAKSRLRACTSRRRNLKFTQHANRRARKGVFHTKFTSARALQRSSSPRKITQQRTLFIQSSPGPQLQSSTVGLCHMLHSRSRGYFKICNTHFIHKIIHFIHTDSTILWFNVRFVSCYDYDYLWLYFS